MAARNRTLDVFELFARTQRAFSITEIACGLNMPVSSCFNLVHALEERGFLYVVDGSRHFYATQKLHDIGQDILAGDQWVRKIEPKLEELRDVTEETIILAKRQQRQVVFLSVLEAPQQIRYSARVGDLKPLHAGACGKALLSALSPRECQILVSKMPLEQRTKSTITDRKKLLAEVQKCKAAGFAFSLGENINDVAALASAVTLEGNSYAVCIAGPMARIIPSRNEHCKQLARTCRELEERP